MTEEKPATDRRIERARVALSKEHYTERLWHSDFVKALIARIDTERTARLAAEARVKVLEDALRVIAKAELYDPTTGIIDADVLAICQQEARTTLKEPANG